MVVKSDEAASTLDLKETRVQALSSISAGNFEEIKKFVDERGMGELHQHLVDKIDQWQQIPVNVAITGQSGAGKYYPHHRYRVA